MSNYSLSRKALLPIALEEAWTFFTQPENLKKITPPKMGFDITGRSADGPVYPGMIITYKVSPLLGIKMNWMTEITHVRENQFFVDATTLQDHQKTLRKISTHHILTATNRDGPFFPCNGS